MEMTLPGQLYLLIQMHRTACNRAALNQISLQDGLDVPLILNNNILPSIGIVN